MSTGRIKRWLQFLVFAIAAAASLATSKKKGWILEADVANDAPGKSRIAFVEATREPGVYLDNGTVPRKLAGYFTGLWSGTERYLIPADRKLQSISIGGSCGGGCSAGGCDPPGGENIRLLSIKPVSLWRREVVTPEKTENLEYEATQFPIIKATHPIRLELTSTGRDGNAYLLDSRINIDWSAYPNGPLATTWSLKVIMEDLCPTEAPCDPPKDSKLEIGQAKRAIRGQY